MKDTSKGKRIPATEILEVKEVIDLRAEIDALKAENPDVFLKLADLIDRYNAATEVAEQVVRSQGVSCGPFDNFSVGVKYDAEKMYEELGEDLYLECGGVMAKVTQYSVDAKKVEAAIAGKKIPDECVDQFMRVDRKYHKPSKIVL